MAGPWLFTISEGSGRSFSLEGSSLPVTIESFQELVADGRIVQDKYWRIKQHWRDVVLGDELFIYTGDRDIGIIGYAHVAGFEEIDGDWYIIPEFDLARSQLLLDNPVPAAIVREWIFPRKNVTNLEAHQHHLRQLLPW